MTVASRVQSTPVSVAVALALTLAAAAAAADGPPGNSAGPEGESPKSPQAGLVALVEGESGRLLEPETIAASLDLDLADAMSTSSEGLVEEALPNGGYRVHLEGRFRQAVFARFDPSGRLVVGHQAMTADALFPHEVRACTVPEAVSGVGHATR